MQAGVPQIISPMGFDQPDNGHRVELLGVGRVVPRAELSGSTLAAALRSLLQDAALESSLARCRAAIAASRAVERCADFLETILGRSSTGDRAPSN
jgi:UDP:flavonoid glycosyltransferase YjiC (YdhE family)